MTEELKPCPFCGEVPDLPSGDGTQYEIECGNCAMAMASVQICDLMTGEERSAEKFTNDRYSEQYVERAKAEAIKQWNTRATLSPAHIEDGEEVEVVGYSIEGRDEIGVARIRRLSDRPFPEHMQEARDWAGPFRVASEPLMTVAQHQRIVAARASKAADSVEDEREAFETDLIRRWKSAHPKAFDCSEEGQKCLLDMMLARTENGEYENLVPREAWQAWQSRAVLSAPPAAGVPDSAYARRIIEAGDALYNELRQWLATESDPDSQAALQGWREICAPTPPASEQQRALVMPELHDLNHHERYRAGWNSCVAEFLRLNPHLAKGEGV